MHEGWVGEPKKEYFTHEESVTIFILGHKAKGVWSYCVARTGHRQACAMDQGGRVAEVCKDSGNFDPPLNQVHMASHLASTSLVHGLN